MIEAQCRCLKFSGIPTDTRTQGLSSRRCFEASCIAKPGRTPAEGNAASSLGPLGFAYLKGHSNARCVRPDAFAKRTCLWNTEPTSVSQNADTVKVGAVVSDTRPCLRPHRVTDPTLPRAVTSASLQSVSLAPELPHMKRADNRTCRGQAQNCNDHKYVRRQPLSAQQLSKHIRARKIED